jgi:UDP-2,4-diacetamido-2,4,6-trideoxy-beta-L-altropyranose hydrolase
MRCLALAQAWQDMGGRAVFAMAETTAALRARLASESCEVFMISSGAGSSEDANGTIAYGRDLQCEWIVVDGYHFTAEYQDSLKAAGFRILFVDDYGHARGYSADLVLNQNVCASEALYENRDPRTQMLLGSRYCLLRREFSAWRDWKRDLPLVGRRVLVTMGGSDPENLTARVVDALALVGIEDLEAIVVVGGSSPHAELVEGRAQGGKNISVRRDVTNIAELMAWADAAVSSAGTTCWELCLLSVPALLVDVAENQTALARELARRRCAIHLGGPRDFTAQQLAQELERLLRSAETRRALSVGCRELVDGRGAMRVVSAMRAGLRLRQAREEDCRVLWEWANDPQVRAAAFSSEPIPWERHQVWFASKMRDPDCRILVAEDERGRAVGQFRVDWRSEQDGDIDVSVAAECRGAGYGAVLIDSGASSVFAERGERLHAFVKVENEASRRAFEQAGFESLGEKLVHEQQAIHYVRSKERDQIVRSE